MKIKYDGKTIDVNNESNVKGEFFATWNYYTIMVSIDEFAKRRGHKSYIVQCCNPTGGYDVDGVRSDTTLKECVQLCFDNIGVLLMGMDYEAEADF